MTFDLSEISMTFDDSEISSREIHMFLNNAKRTVRIAKRHNLTYQTAFVLAHFDIDEYTLNPGFIKAVHNYVWNNDSSHLTKALQRNCNKAMEQLCRVSIKRSNK